MENTSGRSVGLMDFADVLLPGDELFPSARASGTALPLVRRLEAACLLDKLLEAVRNAGGPLAPLDAEGRRAVVARIEEEQPKLFEDVLKAIYLTYYEQPSVVEAIRALGLSYHASPLPDGYPGEPFDPDRDAPRHRRGRFIPTELIGPVDLSAIDFLRNPLA